MNEILFCSLPDYADQAAVDAAVERIFAACPAAGRIGPAANVTLKPNLLAKHPPEHAVTTHPAVVRAVIRAVKRRGAQQITLADSPGGVYTPAVLHGIYRASGLAQVCEEEGAALYDACEFGPRKTGGGLVQEFNLIRPVLEADFLIDLPKMKTHVMTGMTGAVKNLFGCIPGLQKAELHMRFPDRERFGRMMAEVWQCVRPDLVVMDAVLAMEGDGPAGGTPRRVGCLIGGEDAWGIDLAVCRMMGLAPDSVPYLAGGMKLGLCPAALDERRLCGDTELAQPIPGWELPSGAVRLDFTNRFPRGLRWAAPAITRFAAPRPRVRRSGCIGCGKCAEICPQKTIRVENGKAKILPARCIRCFCCHEMCPVKAIDVYRPLGALFNL